MSVSGNSAPQFPLRVIFSDGQMEIIESPEDLLERVDSIDTVVDQDRVWVRDDLGRTVRLRMVNGDVEVIEVV